LSSFQNEECTLIFQLFDPASSTYTYLVCDDATRDAAIIDPVLAQVERDLAELARHGLTLRWILDTHVHADHETAANALKAASGATTAVGASCNSVGHDRALNDGDVLPLGNSALQIIATPGHTPGSVSYVWGCNVFTGDALLIEGCGRTDFQDGDSDVLYHSITRKLFCLPESTIVWPGHDYRFRGSSTIGHEKRHNPRLAGKSTEQFRDLMAALKLAPPKLIDQAVPANRRAGALQSGEPVPAMLMARDLATAFDPTQDALADLRNEAEFSKDALPGARRVDASDIDMLTSMAARHRTLFIVCRSGRMSLQAADALLKSGVNNACHVTGGMMALRARGQA
jgi:glyoxylase-like metal-dependent hydrolase (beta-lactamase superfamily II)/rhodanese-related sulfurtransferase